MGARGIPNSSQKALGLAGGSRSFCFVPSRPLSLSRSSSLQLWRAAPREFFRLLFYWMKIFLRPAPSGVRPLKKKSHKKNQLPLGYRSWPPPLVWFLASPEGLNLSFISIWGSTAWSFLVYAHKSPYCEPLRTSLPYIKLPWFVFGEGFFPLIFSTYNNAKGILSHKVTSFGRHLIRGSDLYRHIPFWDLFFVQW